LLLRLGLRVPHFSRSVREVGIACDKNDYRGILAGWITINRIVCFAIA